LSAWPRLKAGRVPTVGSGGRLAKALCPRSKFRAILVQLAAAGAPHATDIQCRLPSGALVATVTAKSNSHVGPVPGPVSKAGEHHTPRPHRSEATGGLAASGRGPARATVLLRPAASPLKKVDLLGRPLLTLQGGRWRQRASRAGLRPDDSVSGPGLPFSIARRRSP